MPKRLLLAIILSLMILIIFQKINKKNIPEYPVENKQIIRNITVAKETTVESINTNQMDVEEYETESLAISNKKVKIFIDSKGAGINKLIISEKKNSKINLVQKGSENSLELGYGNKEIWKLKKIKRNKITAFLKLKNIEITRKFEITENNDLIVRNIIKNNTGKTVRIEIKQAWENGLGTLSDIKKENYTDTRIFIKLNGKRRSKLKSGKYEGNIEWAGILNRYFIIVFYKIDKIFRTADVIEKDTTGGGCKRPEGSTAFPEIKLISEIEIGPKEVKEFTQVIYIGFKNIKELKKISEDLDKIIFKGFFAPLSMIALKVLLFFNSFTRNYGLAIILLTIVLQIVLYPLTSKSYKSMNDMKKIQPNVSKLREKFKDDPKRMNQEMMGMYKKHKVNPFGGCIPLFMQFPIFISLFAMLRSANELRYAEFLWIHDLSKADVLFAQVPLLKSIPVIGAAGPLPFLMGAIMLLQQKFTTGMDPANKSLTYMMPIVFTFVFIKFPSGLVLYWLSNSIFSFFIQMAINKKNS